MVARADALTLLQGYRSGRGVVETFSVAAPAAGSNFARVTGQGYWERIIALFAVLTTSAVVGNRQFAVEVQDADGNTVGGTAAAAVQPASTVCRYYGLLCAAPATAASPLRQPLPLPWLFLQPGWRLVSQVAALDAGDTITQIRGVVERLGIGPDGTPVGETGRPYTERTSGYERRLERE